MASLALSAYSRAFARVLACVAQSAASRAVDVLVRTARRTLEAAADVAVDGRTLFPVLTWSACYTWCSGTTIAVHLTRSADIALGLAAARVRADWTGSAFRGGVGVLICSATRAEGAR